jgi:hypothetical protein
MMAERIGHLFPVARNDFAFDVGKQFAGETVWNAFRGRQTLQDAVDKQLDSFVVKFVSDVTKVSNSALQTIFDRSSPVLATALAKLGELYIRRNLKG